MSSAGVAVADGGPQMYFCHQCERTGVIVPSPVGDLLCPSCNSGFVEEFQNPDPDPSADFADPFLLDPVSLFLSQVLLPSSSSNPNFNPTTFQGLARESPLEADAFDPMFYLLNLLANRRASGIDYQFVMEDGPSGFAVPANIGDYFVGPGFEQLIQQLAENDPNRYGTPPAAKSAVEALPSVEVDEGLVKSEMAQCAVCMDDFEIGTVVKQMPCKHVYHHDCIIPWLELHNSCPVCRYELPTDDPDYQSLVNSSRSGNTGGNGSNNENYDSAGGSERQRTVERRFTITLPWLFGGSGSSSGSGSSGGASDQHNRE
ncbi:E3 ubiquitin-protein ligase RING1 [Andrographis paniculata]|uniref:E3 ubiquitin-protein ligase RING1 n=1 Tax=Andrographis paniculata TaxID=175694 RepID=UPI0021E75F7B|nr:E3 ubiquitin-protein ligase RING1 [Andrographis paniculata]XP_051122523.1 E3 ubiquitin-protein ligase RING1 [Andrographis paniculata]